LFANVLLDELRRRRKKKEKKEPDEFWNKLWLKKKSKKERNG